MKTIEKQGTEFLVNTETANTQMAPTIIGLSNGGFVVTWQDGVFATGSGTLGDSSSSSIKAQVFDASGAKVGSELLVNSQTENGQFDPAVTVLSGGGFIVTWMDQGLVPPTEGPATIGSSIATSVKAQLFDDDGTKVGSEFLANDPSSSTNKYSPAVTELSNGGFVVTWCDYNAPPPEPFAPQS